MHTLKTKRELEIFEQGIQKGRGEMEEKYKLLILTKRQREIYVYFEEYKSVNGGYPSYGEASKHFGIVSRQNIFIALRNARKKLASISSLK